MWAWSYWLDKFCNIVISILAHINCFYNLICNFHQSHWLCIHRIHVWHFLKAVIVLGKQLRMTETWATSSLDTSCCDTSNSTISDGFWLWIKYHLSLFLCHKCESQAFVTNYDFPPGLRFFWRSSSVTPPPIPPSPLPFPGMQGNILQAEARCTVCGSNRSRMPWLKAGQGISVGLMLGQMSLCGAVCHQTMGPSATVPVGPAWAPGWAELWELSPCPLPAALCSAFVSESAAPVPRAGCSRRIMYPHVCTVSVSPPALMYVLYQSPLLPPVFTAPRFQHLLSGSVSDLTSYVFSVSSGTSYDYVYSLVCSCW